MMIDMPCVTARGAYDLAVQQVFIKGNLEIDIPAAYSGKLGYGGGQVLCGQMLQNVAGHGQGNGLVL